MADIPPLWHDFAAAFLACFVLALIFPGLSALFAWTHERVGKFWCRVGAHSWTPRRIHLPDPVRCKRCLKLKDGWHG